MNKSDSDNNQRKMKKPISYEIPLKAEKKRVVRRKKKKQSISKINNVNDISTSGTIYESLPESESSQRTAKAMEIKYQKFSNNKGFNKKKFSYNETINNNNDTNKRIVMQKKNSLSILGFKTKKKSVDILIKKKNKKQMGIKSNLNIFKITNSIKKRNT